MEKWHVMAGIVLRNGKQDAPQIKEFLGKNTLWYETGAYSSPLQADTLYSGDLMRLVTQYDLRYCYAECSTRDERDGEVHYIGAGAVTSLSIFGVFDASAADYPFWFWSSFVRAQIEQCCYTVHIACPYDITESIYTVSAQEALQGVPDTYIARIMGSTSCLDQEAVDAYLRDVNARRAMFRLGYALETILER